MCKNFERVKNEFSDLISKAMETGDYSVLPSEENSQALFNSMELLRAIDRDPNAGYVPEEIGLMDLMEQLGANNTDSTNREKHNKNNSDNDIRLLSIFDGSSSDFNTKKVLEQIETGSLVNATLHDDVAWVFLSDKGVGKRFPLEPIMSDVSFDELESAGLTDGSTIITIEGVKYRVRLISGGLPSPLGFLHEEADITDSEWNRLIYPIHVGVLEPSDLVNKELFGKLTLFDNEDLGMKTEVKEGCGTLCVEKSEQLGMVVVRGEEGPHTIRLIDSDHKGSNFGWRPVLEIVD